MARSASGSDLAAVFFLGHFLAARNPKAALEATAAGLRAVMTTEQNAETRDLALIAAKDGLSIPEIEFAAQEHVATL